MSEYVTVAREDGIAVLLLDNPPVNALGLNLRGPLFAALEAARDDAAVKGIVIACAGRTFVSGADITEFGTERALAKPSLHDICALLDGLEKPTVAAIHGTALGGGLELALACDLRAASTRAQIGLPEARVGMIPGAGGTQRLTRLCGPGVSARLILGGEVVDGAEAERLGIVEWAVEADALGAFVADTAVRAGGLSRQALLASKDCIAAWHDPQIDGFAREIEKPRELMPTQEARSRVLGFFRRKAG